MAVKRSTFAQRLRDWLRLDDAGDPKLHTTTEVIDMENPGLRSLRLPEGIGERYKVLRVLGKGAFGVVLLARDMMIGRLISIKLFHQRGRQEIYQQFLHEARIAGQIEHPNIITIYDVHEDRRSACIIMEYLPGGNLQTILGLDGPLDEDSALDYMIDITDGLRAAHQMGVIHRDIKPPNVLFNQNGSPVITDFGVAHLPLDARGGRTDSAVTSDEALRIVGTPEYMAPEQMVFGATIDGRADLYSAGLLFYEMLTGRRLCNYGRTRNIEEIARKAQKIDLAKVAEFPATVSIGVQDIILKLIDRSPANRYPDARSLLTALETAREALHAVVEAAPLPLAKEKSTTRAEMFQDILRLFLVDGVISPPERRDLAKRAERLGVPPELARTLEEAIRHEHGLPLLHRLIEYEALAERLLGDQHVSDDDREQLTQLARNYNISEHEQQKIQDRIMFKFHTKAE